MKLHTLAFAIACGVLWGVCVFVWTWWMIIFDSAPESGETIMSTVYLGYTVTGAGSVIGLVWGLIDGLICGALFALVYNVLVDRFGRYVLAEKEPPRSTARSRPSSRSKSNSG